MVTFNFSRSTTALATLMLMCSTFLVASCSSSKAPVYDLGPRRAPQDNPDIVRSMTEKPQAPAPLIPGYDIPAPRYDTPRMIDAPGSEMFPPAQSPVIPPQSYAPIQNMNVATIHQNQPVRRRPAKQFSGPAPSMVYNNPIPYRPTYTPPQPMLAAQTQPEKKTSFFDRVKSIFHSKEKTGTHRVPGGQGYLATEPVNTGNQMYNPKGFAVETGEPRLEDELRGFPETKAERAASLPAPKRMETIPVGKPINPTQLKASPTPVQNSTKTQNTVGKTTSSAKKDEKHTLQNPFRFFTLKRSEPLPTQPKAAPILKQEWVNPDTNNPSKPDNRVLWEEKKLDNPSLEGLSDDPKPVYNAPVKPTARNSSSPAVDKTAPEEAEVLMEFDISEDGELLDIPNVAPAAGQEGKTSSPAQQKAKEPVKSSSNSNN